MDPSSSSTTTTTTTTTTANTTQTTSSTTAMTTTTALSSSSSSDEKKSPLSPIKQFLRKRRSLSRSPKKSASTTSTSSSSVITKSANDVSSSSSSSSSPFSFFSKRDRNGSSSSPALHNRTQSATPIRPKILSVRTVLSSRVVVEGGVEELEKEDVSIEHVQGEGELEQLEQQHVTEQPLLGKEKVTKSSSLLISFSEVPYWLQDNPSILGGYRRLQYTYRGCVKSMFYIHNETGNIYTHLLGALAFIGIAFATLFYTMPIVRTITWTDSFVMSVFFMGAITCLSCSTFFHLFICHSHHVAKAWNKVDYVGIVALIVASFFPVTYYAFHCNTVLTWIYLSLISVFGVCGIIASFVERFAKPEFRVYRTLLFISMGASGVIPMAHAIILYGFNMVVKSASLLWVGLMGVFYILGAVIYASQVPERWFPGKFDYWFHSHQIFHVMVVVAAWCHYMGMMEAYAFWHQSEVSAKCLDGWRDVVTGYL